MSKEWFTGLFFKEEEAAPGAAPAPQPAANPQYAPAPQPTTYGAAPGAVYQTPGYTPPPVAGVVDKKYIDHFEKVLNEANFEGTDYFEFSTALKSMSGAGLPEAQLFQFTFNTMKAMNSTINPGELVARLIDTAGKYVEILNQNKVSFEHDVEAAKQAKVGTLQTRTEQLVKENTDAAEQIRHLQEKIQANSVELTKLSEEMGVQNAKLITSQNNYNATHEVIVRSIEGDREKIKQYLNNVG